MQSRSARLLVCLSLVHCASSEGGTARDPVPVDTPTEQGTGAAAAQPPPLTCSASPACKYSAPLQTPICYGVEPPPDAPTQREVCSCDACKADKECGPDEACVLWSASCRPAQHLCAKACSAEGSCPDGLVCQRGRCGPPGIKPP